MTTEIAIINRSAVALASDSAVTIEIQGESKVYNTVNKLFTLSKIFPVGVMIYGSAAYLGLPWETLIKRFRERLGNGSFEKLDQYVSRFFEFLESPSESSLDQAVQHETTIGQTLMLLQEIGEEIRNRMRGEGIAVPDDEIASENLSRAAELFHQIKEEFFDSREPLNVFANTYDEFVAEFSEELSGSSAAALGWPMLPEGVAEKVVEVAFAATSSDFLRAGHTGLVFAGFGEDELLPQLRGFAVDGMWSSKVKAVPRETSDQSNDHPNVYSFAQSDDSQAFIFGMDPRLQDLLNGIIDQGFADMPASAIDLVDSMTPAQKAAAKEQLLALAPDVAQGLKDQVREFQEREHLNPLARVLASLPKDEMAEMAEALVHISYIKRRFSMALESVGGPIDVAVISKGDGFIWIKRKHYFDPALNPHFFSNYLVNVRRGTDD